MTPELRELYQEVILDHNRAPRNFRPMEDPSRLGEGANPLCGDEVTVYLELDGELIRDISFQGRGCAISKASASLMTLSLKGKTTTEGHALFDAVRRMLTSDGHGEPDADALGRLVTLAGVREFPTRVKCATLSWHTFLGALQGEGGAVSTE